MLGFKAAQMASVIPQEPFTQGFFMQVTGPPRSQRPAAQAQLELGGRWVLRLLQLVKKPTRFS